MYSLLRSKQKIFYYRETIGVSLLAESVSTLSWLAEILEFRNALKGRGGGDERQLLYFIIQRGNGFSILKSLLSKHIEPFLLQIEILCNSIGDKKNVIQFYTSRFF